MVDIFAKLGGATVELDPFPNLVIEDFLPEDVCSALIRDMPPLPVLTKGRPPGDNKRFNLSHAEAMTAQGVSPLWREVLSQAVSQSFLDRMLRLFEPAIREFYPDFETRFAPINYLNAKPRKSFGQRSRARTSIMLDAQIAINTPALTGGKSVRTPHLDRTDKLFIGLLYMRHPEDDSKGADLEFLRPKGESLLYGYQRLLTSDQTDHVRTISYKRNTLVLFLNTPSSLHAVTPRQATPHTRYFINLVGETSRPLFEVATVPGVEDVAPRWRRVMQKLWGRDRGARARL